MRSFEETKGIVDRIRCDALGTRFNIRLGVTGGNRWFLQVGTERECAYREGVISEGWGGRAYVSPHATEDEIAKKVLGLCIAYAEHEVREGYLYEGKRIFGPHISIEALGSVCDQTESR